MNSGDMKNIQLECMCIKGTGLIPYTNLFNPISVTLTESPPIRQEPADKKRSVEGPGGGRPWARHSPQKAEHATNQWKPPSA